MTTTTDSFTTDSFTATIFDEEDSSMVGGIGKFGVLDYVVFGAMLSVSSGIGIFYAWKDRANQTNREFLMADKELAPFPVAMSLLASFQSAVTVLGIPAQMYAFGTQHWAVIISAILAVILTDRVFLPMFFKVNVTSVNEYLDRRFNSKPLRILASLSFILSTVFYLGTVLYGPSLALNSVTPLTVEASVVTIGLVCTFYTTIGGMKAVVWTDVFQIFVMIAGLLMIIIKGVILAGGIEKVWKINSDGGRVQFLNMSESPYSPIPTLWEVILSFGVIWGADYAISQTQVQRYYSTSSLKKARLALYINLPGLVAMLSLGCFSGVVIYANYYNCDPLKLKNGVKRLDQLVPYFVMDTLSYIPGLAGLFVSCVFSGSLSTLSSGFNALSAVTWEDFLSGLTFLPKSNRFEAWTTKFTAMFYGVITIGFAFLSARIPSILQAAIGLSGAVMGPLLGTFLAGALCPFVDSTAALSGLIVGEGVCIWFIVGSLWYPKVTNRLPTTTECPNRQFVGSNMAFTNASFFGSATVSSVDLEYEIPTGMLKAYHLSSYLLPVICFLVTVSVIGIVTLCTVRRKREEINPELLSPALKSLSPCCLPANLKNYVYNENASTENFKVVSVPTENSFEMHNDQLIVDDQGANNNKTFLNGKSATSQYSSNL